jgi:hypothetical protein
MIATGEQLVNSLAYYIRYQCAIIPTNETPSTMQAVFSSYRGWVKRYDAAWALIDGVTIRDFSRALRAIELDLGITLIRGRNTRGKRHVEVTIRPLT